jgi:hypothetical protein
MTGRLRERPDSRVPPFAPTTGETVTETDSDTEMSGTDADPTDGSGSDDSGLDVPLGAEDPEFGIDRDEPVMNEEDFEKGEDDRRLSDDEWEVASTVEDLSVSPIPRRDSDLTILTAAPSLDGEEHEPDDSEE